MRSSASGAQQWLSLVGVIWLQSLSGTNTNFPAYSSQLKNTLSISQLQLNNLAFASDAGKLFGWVSGVAAIYLPLWLVLITGSVLGLAGYGVQYLFVTNQISALPYWQIFALTMIAGNSICWINTVCYVVTIRNFGAFSQIAVGLSTSYQGLSAKIYALVVDVVLMSAASFNKAEAEAYLLLNAVVPLAVTFVAAPLVGREAGGSVKRIEAGFIVMFFISVSTGLYAVISSLSGVSGGLSPLVKSLCMGVFLLVPLEVPIAEKIKQVMANRKWVLKTNEIKVHDVVGLELTEEKYSTEKGLENGEAVKDGAEEFSQFSDEVNEMEVIEEIGVSQMVRRINFWLYFFLYLSGATLGLVYANNLGQIAESRRYSKASALVSLSSSFGFFGRLVPSLVDYLFYKYKCRISRPMSIAIFMSPISAAFFLLAISSTVASLYLSTTIIGLCTGAIISISVSTTSELFGTKNFSVNHNVVVANIPIGSFVFGYLAACLYRTEGKGMENGRCMGMSCYSKTFLVWGTLSFIGTILAVVLSYRTRKFYNQKTQKNQIEF
ncbi:unnamed protein product [Rhodiola kirilowii]